MSPCTHAHVHGAVRAVPELSGETNRALEVPQISPKGQTTQAASTLGPLPGSLQPGPLLRVVAWMSAWYLSGFPSPSEASAGGRRD